MLTFAAVTSLLALALLTATRRAQKTGLIVRCPRTNKWVPAVKLVK